MRQHFGTPEGMDSVKVNIKKDTIGSGKVGAKSASLREYRPMFEATRRERERRTR